MSVTRQSSADLLVACAAYIADMQAILRPKFKDAEWEALFKNIGTPERFVRNLMSHAVEERTRAPNFWTMLDLSTAHLRKEDFELLGRYRGPDADGERDRDQGQSLFVTPCVGGWIVSTSGCLAPRPDDELTSEAREAINADRLEIVRRIMTEGFSDEFVAVFRYAYENGVADIRFHGDAHYLPGFPRFDPVTDAHEDDEGIDVGAVPAI